MKSICVYCGSKTGKNPAYQQLAIDLGKFLAHANYRLVYGAGNVGLMGLLANSCLEAGGKVLGIIPQHLMEWEVGHTGLSDLKIVGSMHERKEEMARESDSFVALPGGFGTLDELFEIITWKQLRLHQKNIHLINLNGFFDSLLTYLNQCVEEEFVSEFDLNYIQVHENLEDFIEAYQLPLESNLAAR